MIRRILTSVLVIAMLASGCFAKADELSANQNEITVAATTRIEGYFFTDLWSANTADHDVRTLLHGYSTVVIGKDGVYHLDDTAIAGMQTQTDSVGNKTFTFTVNPNLKYSDGSALTARDYVFSVLLQASPELRALGAAVAMDQLEGYGAYAEGKTACFSGVRLIDDRRFSLTVSAAYLPYFYELMYVNVIPYPMAVLAPGFDVRDDGQGAYLAYTGQVADGEEPPSLGAVLKETILGDGDGYLYFPRVTSGPYRLTGFDRESGEASFERNEYYLGNFEGEIPQIEAIRFVNVQNGNVRDRLASGEVDIVNKLTDGEVIDACAAGGLSGLSSVQYPRAGYGFLAFACEDAVTGSQNVRQAVALLTDADAYVKDFLGSHGQRVYANYGLGQWMFEVGQSEIAGLPAYDFDPDGAVALLEKDGFTLNEAGEPYDGQGVRYKREADGSLTKLQLNWAALKENTGCEKLMKYTVSNLRQAGFEVNVDEMDFAQMLDVYYRRTERSHNLFYLASNFTMVYDPYYSVSNDEAHQGIQNTTGIDDAQLMDLAKRMRSTVAGDTQTYIARWAQFQRRYAQVLPTYPLYSNAYCDVYSSRIANYHPERYNSWAVAILYAYLR